MDHIYVEVCNTIPEGTIMLIDMHRVKDLLHLGFSLEEIAAIIAQEKRGAVINNIGKVTGL